MSGVLRNDRDPARTEVDEPPGAAGDDVPRRARVLTALVLTLLIVPGVIGFDAWPLTGWRLFSVERGDTQDRWVIEAVDAGGEARIVSLEELPLRYRHAEWPLRDIAGAPVERRDELCGALLEAVRGVEPTVVELRIAVDHARLVEQDGRWVLRHDLEVMHACAAEDGM